MASVSPGKMLRAVVEESTILIPGAFDALVGKMIERAGFRAMYLSGAAFSAGALALPDIGLFTLSELVAESTRLTRATTIPLIVDADTGFGEAVNVERTVTELIAAGAAAIQLEDQRLPKRCGHLSGKSLVEPAEMGAKIRAAVAARVERHRDPGPYRCARRLGHERGARSCEAISRRWSGLDFSRSAGRRPRVRAIRPRDSGAAGREYDRVRQKSALAAHGIETNGIRRRAVASDAVARGDESRQRRALGDLGAGTQQKLLDRMQSRQELYDLLGYTGYEDRDRAYFQNEANS